jgi:hypothetical protein
MCDLPPPHSPGSEALLGEERVSNGFICYFENTLSGNAGIFRAFRLASVRFT